jgi:hypothetical protein
MKSDVWAKAKSHALVNAKGFSYGDQEAIGVRWRLLSGNDWHQKAI